MRKQGSLTAPLVLMIVSFITVAFFVIWTFGHNMLTEQLLEVGANSDTEMINITEATQNTFGYVNASLPTLKWLALAIFLSMAIGIMVSNFLVKAHPAFLILYFLFTAIVVIFSVYITNAYEAIVLNPTIGPSFASFGSMHYVMLNLPVIMTVVGFMGALFLFVGITVDSQSGGGVSI